MKRFVISIIGAVALALSAQGQQRDLFETEFSSRLSEDILTLEERPLNEIRLGDFVYSGILIEAFRAENPLQLISPFAPPEYGSPDDNLVLDPILKKPIGLRLFSFRF